MKIKGKKCVLVQTASRTHLAPEHQDLPLAPGNPGPAVAAGQRGALHHPATGARPHPHHPHTVTAARGICEDQNDGLLIVCSIQPTGVMCCARSSWPPGGCQDARCGPTDLCHSCFPFRKCCVTAHITHRTLHIAFPKKIYRLMGQPSRVCIVLCCSCLPMGV